jgi:hypothetical protein
VPERHNAVLGDNQTGAAPRSAAQRHDAATNTEQR